MSMEIWKFEMKENDITLLPKFCFIIIIISNDFYVFKHILRLNVGNDLCTYSTATNNVVYI